MDTALHYIIIDDDFTNNLICQYLFKKADPRVSVKVFTEPAKGMRYIEEVYLKREEPLPTVLLLDINMPGMTGWEFLDLLNQHPQRLTSQFRIYILSSSKEDFSREIDRYPAVQGYLSKPFTQDKVDYVNGKLEKKEFQI